MSYRAELAAAARWMNALADQPLEVLLQDADGKQVTKVDIGFAVDTPGDLEPGEQASVPIPLLPDAVALPAPGAYSFELLNRRSPPRFGLFHRTGS